MFGIDTIGKNDHNLQVPTLLEYELKPVCSQNPQSPNGRCPSAGGEPNDEWDDVQSGKG